MHTQRRCVGAILGLSRAEGERESEGKLAPHSYTLPLCDPCTRSMAKGLWRLYAIDLDQDLAWIWSKAQHECMKTNRFLLSLSSTPFWVHPCWLDTSYTRVESRTCFQCPKPITMRDSSVWIPDSLLAMCYWTLHMTYYTHCRERKSQNDPRMVLAAPV